MSSPQSVPDSEVLQSYLDSWRRDWPEWSIAERFIPQSLRTVAQAWFAVQQQWEGLLPAASESMATAAKQAWWKHEIDNWQQGQALHPLGSVLCVITAPWAQLATTMTCLQTLQCTSADVRHGYQELWAMIHALATIDNHLFGRTVSSDPQALLIQWLDARRRRGGAGASPPGQTADQWRQQLLTMWPNKPSLARPRRIWLALIRRRIQDPLISQRSRGDVFVQLWRSWQVAMGPD